MADSQIPDGVGPNDSISQVGERQLVPVPRSDYSERKRLYGKMAWETKHLTPQALAIYTAAKGCHKKRQKIMELFVESGCDLGMAMTLYMDKDNIERKANTAKWCPMTAKQMKDRVLQI